MSNIENLSGYKFQNISLSKIRQHRIALRNVARDIGIKGSILLGKEGCNMFIAATKQQNAEFLEKFFQVFPELSNITFKTSWSNYPPFSRMLIKEKQEIITLAQQQVDAVKHTAAEITAQDFADNYDDYIVLDTRNNYETKLGKFKNCIDLDLASFRDFPAAVTKTLAPTDKPIVIYCTGGIRCEKAGLWMEQAGYKNVYQLKDGILGYFEQCGNKNYEGECFVFDKRVGVDHKLQETKTQQCYECRTPWKRQDLLERSGVCSCGNKVIVE